MSQQTSSTETPLVLTVVIPKRAESKAFPDKWNTIELYEDGFTHTRPSAHRKMMNTVGIPALYLNYDQAVAFEAMFTVSQDVKISLEHAAPAAFAKVVRKNQHFQITLIKEAKNAKRTST